MNPNTAHDLELGLRRPITTDVYPHLNREVVFFASQTNESLPNYDVAVPCPPYNTSSSAALIEADRIQIPPPAATWPRSGRGERRHQPVARGTHSGANRGFNGGYSPMNNHAQGPAPETMLRRAATRLRNVMHSFRQHKAVTILCGAAFIIVAATVAGIIMRHEPPPK
ncbi:hypothetical protein HGRIS_007059 [Hohenbuehelia grisea]|uniref:Uncharacterized protein n=1 Tax=Hohenbuehelia grisea TaxID=104357 RepID=A0ABR3JAW7_9AGAR